MGNEQQKQQQNEQISVFVNHPNFKNVKLFTENGQTIMQLNIGVQLSDYEKWKQTFLKANLNSPMLLLPKKEEFNRKGLCSISGTLKLNFNNYSYLLAEQINIRNSRKSKFQEWELWYLLLNLSTAQHYMKSKTGEKIGDIRPQNIFLNDRGDIKISNIYSWPKQNTNYRKTFENEITYLAPEDMERLQNGIMEDSGSSSSQVFAIGLTLLSAAMLRDFLFLYDIKNFIFNEKEATRLLDEWKSNKIYSQIFTAVVSNLCSFSPNKRLQENQLWDWISKYEKPINEKKNFIIYSAPAKIDQQVLEIRNLLIGKKIRPQTTKENIEIDKLINDQSYVSPYVSEIQSVPQNNVFHRQKQLGSQRSPFSKQYLPMKQPYFDNSKHIRNINSPIFQDYQNEKSTNTLQAQSAPQSVSKGENIINFTPQFKDNYKSSPLHQLHLPRDKKQTNVEVLDSNTQKLNFFQNIIYPHQPWGGKIEQTIYIRKPEAGYEHSIPEYK